MSMPTLPASERLRRAGTVAWSLIGVLIVAAMVVWALIKVRVIFPPVVLAMLIIYLLNPIVTRLERRGVNRTLGAIFTYVVIFGIVSAVAIGLTPVIQREATHFSEQWPGFRNNIINQARDVSAWADDHLGVHFRTDRLSCVLGADATIDPTITSQADCDKTVRDFHAAVSRRSGRLIDIGSSLLQAVLLFVVAPLIALYMLVDLPRLKRQTVRLVPESHRDEVVDLASKAGRIGGNFVRGQLFLGLLVAVLSALGFAIIGLPFWLVIGAIAGIFTLVPVVGGLIATVIAALVGLVGGTLALAIKAIVVEFAVQQINNHFFNPWVMRAAVQLHPATVMLAILAGGALGGFWGVFLAVPIVAVSKLLLSHVWQTRVLGAEVSPFAGTAAPPD
ncbi:MAG: AI-2E family transporter [Actinomycetota bacterium]|nr:AI-2E family transporter [Actinomycetota bacterium]